MSAPARSTDAEVLRRLCVAAIQASRYAHRRNRRGGFHWFVPVKQEGSWLWQG
jgi:hypothetical protein